EFPEKNECGHRLPHLPRLSARLLSVAGIVILFSGSVFGATGMNGSIVGAVKSGDLSSLRKALGQHTDPNEAEADGTCALHLAVNAGRLDLVGALIAAGANVNAKNTFGLTPLALA